MMIEEFIELHRLYCTGKIENRTVYYVVGEGYWQSFLGNLLPAQYASDHHRKTHSLTSNDIIDLTDTYSFDVNRLICDEGEFILHKIKSGYPISMGVLGKLSLYDINTRLLVVGAPRRNVSDNENGLV